MSEPRDLEMPSDHHAEVSVLSAMILSEHAQMNVLDILEPRYFHSAIHRIIYTCMATMFDQGQPIDTTTLIDALRRENKLSDVGGTTAITSLTQTMASAANAVYYAGIIKKHAIKRALIDVGYEVSQLGLDPSISPEQAIDRAETAIYGISAEDTTGDFAILSQVLGDLHTNLIELGKAGANAITGIPTGFTEFDHVTSGMHGGQLLILAARPGMGKSALVLNIALNVLKATAKTVAFFSLEMSAMEIAQRSMAQLTNISFERLRTGDLSDSEWEPIAKHLSILSQMPFMIDDSPGITVMQIRQKCRRLVRDGHDLGLVIVDYLQLMTGSGKTDNRAQEVAEFSRGLKMLAKELDVPVIALSQLSRKPDDRTDKRPQLSDLRESGAIEQDADLVMFVYRPDQYDGVDDEGMSELLIRKHRAGRQASIVLRYVGNVFRFESVSQDVAQAYTLRQAEGTKRRSKRGAAAGSEEAPSAGVAGYQIQDQPARPAF